LARRSTLDNVLQYAVAPRLCSLRLRVRATGERLHLGLTAQCRALGLSRNLCLLLAFYTPKKFGDVDLLLPGPLNQIE
jgi:hypothetical protein